MNDQVRVRMCDGSEYIQEQANSCLHVQLALVAVHIDRFAFNVFKDEVGLSSRGDAGIEKVGNMWMGEPAENRTFLLESFFANATEQAHTQELDRSLAF